jgi:hypothetical protein
MPPRGVKSPKRKRQYEKIKKSAKKQGKSTKTAKRIAAATTNKQEEKKVRQKRNNYQPGASRKPNCHPASGLWKGFA